jgi:hypothetical protein
VPTGEQDERHNLMLSADARAAIEHRGRWQHAPTTLWALDLGLDRWRELPDVERISRARRALLAAGMELGRLDTWHVTIRAGKRRTLRRVSGRTRGRLGDVATVLGLNAEVLGGLCVLSGLVDMDGIPPLTSERIGRDLTLVLGELADRACLAERLAFPATPRQTPRVTTWAELIEGRVSRNRVTRVT